MEKSGKEYVLKPNSEGGGHNFYGEEAVGELKRLSGEERKKFILMSKIETLPLENILMEGRTHTKASCVYEVSQYGILAIENDELLKCDTCGFLIRIKPEHATEGGIMVGVGSICSWLIKE